MMSRGMSTSIGGQDIPVGIAYGYGHRVERQYDAGGAEDLKWPAGQCSLDLPWFRDIRDAIKFLKLCPFPGRIQTWVLDPDGAKPSWITAGQYFSKVEGGMRDVLEQNAWIKQHILPDLDGGQLKSDSVWWFKIKYQDHPDVMDDNGGLGAVDFSSFDAIETRGHQGRFLFGHLKAGGAQALLDFKSPEAADRAAKELAHFTGWPVQAFSGDNPDLEQDEEICGPSPR